MDQYDNAGTDARTPVIVAVGQFVLQTPDRPDQALPPSDIAARSGLAALQDAGCSTLANEIDTLYVTRSLADSLLVKPTPPFGESNNLPRSIAIRLGITPERLIYGETGGQAPQRQVNEIAEKIFAGECDVVMLTGAEAIGIEKKALRSNWSLEWWEKVDPHVEDRGPGKGIVSDWEYRYGIGRPAQVYSLFEHAWRHKHGLDWSEHRRLMAHVMAPFSRVAANDENAFFPVAREEEFLFEVSSSNYLLVDPYTKYLVAQDAVNMGASVILTSVGRARSLGIPESNYVYLHGYADADDKLVTERADLSTSLAIKAAGQLALSSAGLSIDEIIYFDLYSCFPCAVIFAAEALKLELDDVSHPPTVTGGLPFFGAPGNNYSMHAIANMAKKLRAEPSEYGLVLANGGFLSKESVGIYSCREPDDWKPVSSAKAQADVDAQQPISIADTNQQFKVESYSVVYDKTGPVYGFILARADEGGRQLAKVGKDDEATLRAMVSGEPIGRDVKIEKTEKGNFFIFSGIK